jgi:DNA-binding NarL/FixJ family response regulator
MRTPDPKLTVVLVDRRPVWLDTLERTMWWIGATVAGKATTVAGGSALVKRAQPRLLVVGEDLAGETGGLALVQAARLAAPGVKIVVTSSREDGGNAAAAFGSGANAYLLTRGTREDLAVAIRQLFKPTVFFAPRNASAVVDEVRAEGPVLTPRELEILGLAAEGRSNADVARRLWVTEQTVKFHLSNVYRKLGVSNRTEASRWAQHHGLLDRAPLEQEAAA